jgi:hypothetical protein
MTSQITGIQARCDGQLAASPDVARLVAIGGDGILSQRRAPA